MKKYFWTVVLVAAIILMAVVMAKAGEIDVVVLPIGNTQTVDGAQIVADVFVYTPLQVYPQNMEELAKSLYWPLIIREGQDVMKEWRVLNQNTPVSGIKFRNVRYFNMREGGQGQNGVSNTAPAPKTK